MNQHEKLLSGIAALLLTVAVFSMSVSPLVCLPSATCALALAIYLRHRGAFRDGNTPLAGAFLIGGSSMMLLTGVFIVSPLAFLIVAGVILVPILLFLLAFGMRERFRLFFRWVEQQPRDDEQPPP